IAATPGALSVNPDEPGTKPKRRRRHVRWLLYALGGLGVVFLLISLPCMHEVRISTGLSWSGNNLRQLGLALQNYHQHQGQLPPAVVLDKNGQPLIAGASCCFPTSNTTISIGSSNW